MPFATNITRRPGSANWYFRRAWPKEIQPLVGKKEHWESLKTTDQREARTRAAAANWRFEQRISELRQRHAPDQEEIRRLIRQFYDRELLIDHDARIGPGSSGSDHMEYGELFRPGLVSELKKHLANGETVLVEWAADEIIQREDWLIERGSRPYRELCHKLQRAWLDALRRANERDEGDFDEAPQYDLLKGPDTPGHSKKAKAGETIMELFERFAKEQKRQKPSTLNQSRKIVRRFAEFVGIDANISAVTPKNARDWKFALQSWPAKANEIRDFRGLAFKRIIEANRFVSKPVINEPTIAKYLSALGSFGKWLKRHSFIEHHPTEGLLPERDRRKKRGLPFTMDELGRVFASPLFTGCAGDKREYEPGDVQIRDDRYWLFPVELFTGARVGELCQLRIEDLREEDGTYFFRITDEGEKMSVKNASSVRDIPLHPELIRLGFLEHVEGLRSGGGKHIFPRWSRNVQGEFGETSKWLNAYLCRIGVKTSRLLVFQSMRHNFADALRNAGYHEAQFKPLLGHSEMTVTRGYGTAPDLPLSVSAEMVAAVAYPGLDLSPLYV